MESETEEAGGLIEPWSTRKKAGEGQISSELLTLTSVFTDDEADRKGFLKNHITIIK